MSNIVDQDETAHMSRLIWIYAVCKILLLSPVAVKVKESHCSSIFYLLHCISCFRDYIYDCKGGDSGYDNMDQSMQVQLRLVSW